MPGIDSLCKLNPLTAYQFDRAVTTFGRILSNALQETVEVGAGNNKRRVAKYRLDDLLDERFQFKRENPLAIFKTFDIYEEVT